MFSGFLSHVAIICYTLLNELTTNWPHSQFIFTVQCIYTRWSCFRISSLPSSAHSSHAQKIQQVMVDPDPLWVNFSSSRNWFSILFIQMVWNLHIFHFVWLWFTISSYGLQSYCGGELEKILLIKIDLLVQYQLELWSVTKLEQKVC